MPPESALAASETKEAQALEIALRELHYQKKALDEHALVSVSDANQKIVYANEKFCEISQFDLDELVEIELRNLAKLLVGIHYLLIRVGHADERVLVQCLLLVMQFTQRDLERLCFLGFACRQGGFRGHDVAARNNLER